MKRKFCAWFAFALTLALFTPAARGDELLAFVPDMGMSMSYPSDVFHEFHASNNGVVLVSNDGKSPGDNEATVRLFAGQITPSLPKDLAASAEMALRDRAHPDDTVVKKSEMTQRGNLDIHILQASYTDGLGRESVWYSITHIWFNEFLENRPIFSCHLVLDCDAEKFEKYMPLLDKMSLTLADHETEPLEEDAADGPMSEESDGPEE